MDGFVSEIARVRASLRVSNRCCSAGCVEKGVGIAPASQCLKLMGMLRISVPETRSWLKTKPGARPTTAEINFWLIVRMSGRAISTIKQLGILFNCAATEWKQTLNIDTWLATPREGSRNLCNLWWPHKYKCVNINICTWHHLYVKVLISVASANSAKAILISPVFHAMAKPFCMQWYLP